MTTAQRTSVAFCRRRASAGDEGFLFELYSSTREDLDVLGWPDATRRQFCELQWRAQRAGYATTHPGALDEVVEVEGQRVGRLLVDAGVDDLHVVDLALLPGHRGQGLGAALLAEVQREAASTSRACASTSRPATRRARSTRLGSPRSARTVCAELRWTP